MATVNRPPFWVPRQGLEEPWLQPPESYSSGALQILTARKFFGQGGQVPTKRYAPLYTQDDPPMWQGAPYKSYIAYNNINETMLRQPGQVTQHNYAPQMLAVDDPPMWQGNPLASQATNLIILQNQFATQLQYRSTLFDYRENTPDDPPMWQGSPAVAKVLRNLTQQKMYGAPGQVVTRNYSPIYASDDPTTYVTSHSYFNSDILYLLTEQKFFGAGGQGRQFRSNLTYDDSSYWNGEPVEANANLYTVSSTVTTIMPPLYVPRPSDDNREWQGQSVISKTLLSSIAQRFFGAPGQAVTFRPNFTHDDPAFWQGCPIGKNVPLSGIQGPRPLSVYKVNYYSEDAFWQGSPTASVIQFQLSNVNPVMAPLYVLTGGDISSFWQGAPYVNRTVFPPISQVKFYGQAGQGYPYRPRFDFDDSPPWFPPLDTLNSSLTGILANQTSFLAPSIFWMPDDPDEMALWSGSGVQSNLKVLSIPPTPPALLNSNSVPTALFVDDPSPWVGQPIANWTLRGLTKPVIFGQGGQAPPFRPHFTLNDPPEFQGVPYPSRIITIGAQTLLGRVGFGLPPFRLEFLDNDAAVWFQQTPQHDFVLINTKIIYPPGTTVAGLFNLRWGAAPFNYDVGEAPGWAGSPVGENYQLTQPGPPVPPSPSGMFTVSGENVEQNFQEFFSGVSYTDAPIPKRTA